MGKISTAIDKTKSIIMKALLLFVVFFITYILFASGTLYIEFGNMSIKAGINLKDKEKKSYKIEYLDNKYTK